MSQTQENQTVTHDQGPHYAQAPGMGWGSGAGAKEKRGAEPKQSRDQAWPSGEPLFGRIETPCLQGEGVPRIYNTRIPLAKERKLNERSECRNTRF